MSKIKVSVKDIILILVILLNLISPILFIEINSVIKEDPKKNYIFDNNVKSSSIQNPREGYAIICGVSDYPGDENDLSYCDEDVEDMYNFIKNKYHIPETNIIKLVDSEATITAISDSITSISSQMDSNDVLFFSYSGHGSSDIGTSQQNWHIESSHDYSNNEDQTWHLSVPGASLMRVHFSRIDVEYYYDRVYIGDYNEPNYYSEYFTGNYATDVWSNWVFTDDIYVRLITDVSDTDWGFEVDMVEIGHFQAPYSICPYDGLGSGLTGDSFDSFLDEVPGEVVTVLDSCHSGGVGQNIAHDNRYILTASDSSEFSLEDPDNQNGLFTDRFLRSWNNSIDINNDGVVSYEENFDEVYASTVSRSTSVGYPFHPQEFDGIDGELILEPNGKINSVTQSGDDQLQIEFALSGLGGGKLVIVYYDFAEQKIIKSEITENLQNCAGWQQKSFVTNIPNQEISGITLKVIQSYRNYSEIDNASIELENLENFDLSYNNDYDGDTLSDAYEFEIGFNLWDSDWDNDGLTDDIELRIGTDSLSLDTDYDGMPDGWEYNNGLNPSVNDANEDPDFDGLVNSEEYYYGTDPLDYDTDNDNFSDKEELDKGTNPLKSLSNPFMRGVLITGGIIGFLSLSYVFIKKKFIKPSTTLSKKTFADSTRVSPIYRDNSSTRTSYDNYNISKPQEETNSDIFENPFSSITQNANLKFCSNCGALIIDEKSIFCITCGNRLV